MLYRKKTKKKFRRKKQVLNFLKRFFRRKNSITAKDWHKLVVLVDDFPEFESYLKQYVKGYSPSMEQTNTFWADLYDSYEITGVC